MTLCRPCLDCGSVAPTGSRCPRCRSRWEASRGTSTQRGYGSTWRRTSQRVIARDGGVCAYCGDVATTSDHVVPKSKGGTDDLSNLVAACRPCNSRKKDR